MTKFFFSLFFSFSLFACGQKDINGSPNFEVYRDRNIELIEAGNCKESVIFLGNSITQEWAKVHPAFFTDHNYIGRGISGHTSPQLLLRFRKDVIELKPAIVVINIGTNDIAENAGKYNPEFTLDNIISMTEIARANNIKVILTSVLPVDIYPWRKELGNVSVLVDALNENIRNYALANNIPYVDYNALMRAENGGMQKELASDGVHPISEGYTIMESVIQPVIESMRLQIENEK